MEIFIKISQFILSLGIIVLLHELGHFGFAKLFKTRVEKFYLFINLGFSLFKFKRGDTTYGIGWLPLGGYCKISGMIDESMDTKALKEPPQPWEFRAKPAWQRLLIISGGVLVNFMLGLFLYTMVLYVWGKEYLPVESATYGISVDSLAYQSGFRNGDKIISVGNKHVESFSDVIHDIVLGEAKTVQVMRDGMKTDIEMPPWLIDRLIKADKISFIAPRFPFIIYDFIKDSPGQRAGLAKDDLIVGLNNDTIAYFDEFKTLIGRYKNKDVSVRVRRGNDTLSYTVHIPESGLLGLYPAGMDRFFKIKKHSYTFWQSIPAGINEGFSTLGSYVSQFKLIFKHKGYESVGSFISFTRIFPGVWDWQSFFTLTAFLSIILAFMNILPIPALDGGFIMFILYELILRRKPSDKFLEYAQLTGMMLLLGLLLYATFNDIMRFVIK